MTPKTAEEIAILIKMGEAHLLKANAHEKLQIQACLKILKELKAVCEAKTLNNTLNKDSK